MIGVLSWQAIMQEAFILVTAANHEIVVRVIPDRAELARLLLGAGKKFSPQRDGVAELAAEREADG